MDHQLPDGAVTLALQDFFERYEQKARLTGGFFPPVEPDAAWPSECQFCPGDKSLWKPVRQERPVDFSGLEHALELTVHDDIKAYYGSYWASSLEATAEEGHVSLIQLWNPEDFDRLVANLIGHALEKRKQKQAMTVFIANTEPDSEYFLSIDNDQGAVVLEHPSRGCVRTVEACVADFLDRLEPDLSAPALN